MRLLTATLLTGALGLSGCCEPLPPEPRAELDDTLGRVETPYFALASEGGLLHVREVAAAGPFQLRASGSELRFTITRKATGPSELVLTIANIFPGTRLRAPAGVLTADGTASAGVVDAALPTVATWRLRVPQGLDSLALATEPQPAGRFSFLALGDIQTGIDRFGDLVAAMNQQPAVDFLLLLGDLTECAAEDQFARIESAFAQLRFPVFATPGNHDTCKVAEAYQRRFGRASYSFTHRGARVSSVDSASLRLASMTMEQLTGWLAAGQGGPQIVFSHVPSTDPNPGRATQWTAREDAERFEQLVGDADVSLLLFGHIHLFAAWEIRGGPARISGGGGAPLSAPDQIGRHFLRVDVSEDAAMSGRTNVTVVRVD